MNVNLSNQVENGFCIHPVTKQNGNQKSAGKIDRSAYKQLEAKYEKTQKLLVIANCKINQSINLAEQPTSTILSTTLEKSKVIELRLKDFQTDLDTLFKKTKEFIAKTNLGNADHIGLRSELVTEDGIYEIKLNTYRDILPLFMKTLKHLEKQMTTGTRISFTDTQLAAFSSKQGKPLQEVKFNDTEFDKQLKACDDLFKKLSNDLQVIGETLNFIKLDLNSVDHNVGALKSGAYAVSKSCFDYSENKSRLSPLDKNFRFEKTTIANDVVAIAI